MRISDWSSDVCSSDLGGYGMGFTFRAALAGAGDGARVIVAEVVPEILEWARGPLAQITGICLEDPRGEVVIADVAALIEDAVDGTAPRSDAILDRKSGGVGKGGAGSVEVGGCG